jgi:hypothetical protein
MGQKNAECSALRRAVGGRLSAFGPGTVWRFLDVALIWSGSSQQHAESTQQLLWPNADSRTPSADFPGLTLTAECREPSSTKI